MSKAPKAALLLPLPLSLVIAHAADGNGTADGPEINLSFYWKVASLWQCGSTTRECANILYKALGAFAAACSTRLAMPLASFST
jgi:hypothetical protein